MQQRWILWGVLAAVVMALGLAGAVFGYKEYKQNRPAGMWVPLPFMNPEIPDEDRREFVKMLNEKLREPELLLRVASDIPVREAWKLGSDDEVVKEMDRRLFVEMGSAETPEGRVPSVNIGFNGKRRETALLGQLSLRIMDDVWKIIGVEKPKQPVEPR
jgi:uncharacterized membrane protein